MDPIEQTVFAGLVRVGLHFDRHKLEPVPSYSLEFFEESNNAFVPTTSRRLCQAHLGIIYCYAAFKEALMLSITYSIWSAVNSGNIGRDRI